MIKVVDKNTRMILQPGALYNNQRIKRVYIDSQTEDVVIEYQTGFQENIKDAAYVLPEYVEGIFKYDYVVDSDYNLYLIDFRNNQINTINDSMRVVGNKLFDPEMNLIYNTTKKYYYDKVDLKNSTIMKENDIQFISIFGDEKVYLYLYYEYISKKHVKPIATLSLESIKLFNGTQLHQRDILRTYDKPKEFIDSKKKAVTLELIQTVLNSLPELIYEIDVTPTQLIELLKDYHGYMRLYVYDPKLKLKSKLHPNNNKLILIATKFPQITEAFNFNYVDFKISEQLGK